MSWVMRRVLVLRQTCRHARETITPHPSIVHTKDGRWVMANLGTRPGETERLVALLERYGMDAGLDPEKPSLPSSGRFVPGTGPSTATRDHGMEAVQRFVRAFTYENVPWREAQEAGMLWAPLRKPHENAMDPHWLARQSCTDVEHPELGRSFRYATSKWLATGTSWSVGRRAPLLNEDAKTVVLPRDPDLPVIDASARAPHDEGLSPRGKPFPLHGIRILDFTWFLASAGGTRFLSAFGAESIKVELKSHPDTRMAAMAPVGGRAARDRATGPLPGVTDPDMGGQFNNKNPGKRGISLNVRHPKGLEIAQAPGGDVGRRRGGLLAGRPRQLGAGLRRAARHQAGHHLRPAVGHGGEGHLRPLSHRRADRELLFRLVGDVRAPRAGDAGRVGLLLPGLDGRLQLRAGDPHRALPSSAYRRRAVGRRLAVRGGALHQRHHHPRLVGQRAHLVALRQPLAVQAGGTAQRLSLCRGRSVAHHRLLHGRRMARADRGRWTSGVGERRPVQGSRGAAGAPGCARCPRRRLDAIARWLRGDARACSAPACRPACARRRGTVATTTRSWRRCRG